MKSVLLIRSACGLTFFLGVVGVTSLAQTTALPLIPTPAFYSDLQFIYPDFSAGSDTAAIRENLNKYYCEQSWLANEASKLRLDTAQTIKTEIELITKLAKQKYLAEKMRTYQSQKEILINEEDLIAYYNRNKSKYIFHGKVSFIKLMIAEVTDEKMRRGLAILSPYQKVLPTDINQIEKVSEDGILLSVDFEIPLVQSQMYTKYLENQKIGDLIGPLILDEQTVFILILDITQNVIVPYVQVRERCILELKAEKQRDAYLQIKRESQRLYPITFSP